MKSRVLVIVSSFPLLVPVLWPTRLPPLHTSSANSFTWLIKFLVLSLYDFLSEILPQPSPLPLEASLLLSFHRIVYNIPPTPPPD